MSFVASTHAKAVLSIALLGSLGISASSTFNGMPQGAVPDISKPTSQKRVFGVNLLSDQSPTFYTDPSASASVETASDTIENRKVDFRVVDIRSAGKEDWMVQFYYQFMTAGLSGKPLRLEFTAKSETPTAITVRCQATSAPYESLGLSESCKIGKDWKKFSFDFTCKPAGEYTVPIFWLGKVPTVVSIAEISLREAKNASPAGNYSGQLLKLIGLSPKEAGVTLHTNLNRIFDGEFYQWSGKFDFPGANEAQFIATRQDETGTQKSSKGHCAVGLFFDKPIGELAAMKIAGLNPSDWSRANPGEFLKSKKYPNIVAKYDEQSSEQLFNRFATEPEDNSLRWGFELERVTP